MMMVCEDTKHGSWNLSINKRRYSTQFTQPTHYLLNKNDEKNATDFLSFVAAHLE